jgi:hypothetical protein
VTCHNTTINSIDENIGKSIYFPYAICLWSSIAKVEPFRKIMGEVQKILNYQNPSLSEEMIRNYRHSELLHLMVFLSGMIRPPSYTTMNLNFRNFLNVNI